MGFSASVAAAVLPSQSPDKTKPLVAETTSSRKGDCRKGHTPADAEHRDIRLQFGALRRILDDPEASIEEIAWVTRESARLHAQAHGLQIEALAGLGRCLRELKTLTGLKDAELLRVVNDGSLLRASRERCAELRAAA